MSSDNVTPSRRSVLGAAAATLAGGLATTGAGSAFATPSGCSGISSTLGPVGAFPARLYGVNYPYSGANNYPDRYAELAALNGSSLRYPAGSGANRFEWRVGKPIPTSGTYAFTLDKLLIAYELTGAPPIFVLNMVTSTLADQVEMLHSAQSLGLPIEYLELANEVYSQHPASVAAFPTPTDYGVAVAEWVTELRQLFPQARIAAVGTFGTNTPRKLAWNVDVMEAAIAGGGVPDALTLHAYPKPQAGAPGTSEELFKEVRYLLREAVPTIMGGLPGDPLEVWMTEYNVGPAFSRQNSWDHGLAVALLCLLMLERPEVTVSNVWASFVSPSSGPSLYTGPAEAPILTPWGLAFQWIATVSEGAIHRTPIEFADPPLFDDGTPALIGYKFSSRGSGQGHGHGHGHSETLVANFSAEDVTLNAGQAIGRRRPYRQVTADPVAEMSDAEDLTYIDGRVHHTLDVPAYSLTWIS